MILNTVVATNSLGEEKLCHNLVDYMFRITDNKFNHIMYFKREDGILNANHMSYNKN
jgi:hypothetical protein